MDFDIAFLGASKVADSTNAVMWEPYVTLSNDTQDVEAFGPTDVFQSLGVSSMPWPRDASGYAEGIILRHCGGRNAICLGGRDTRTSKVTGNMKPGDTVIHSTGPEQAAQLQLKEAKRQAVLVTKDSGGKTMAVILDGKNDKVQITAFGGVIEMIKDGGLSLIAPDGTGILIKGGKIHFMGTPMLGAGNAPGLCFMLGPPTGSPGGPASVPLLPCMGVAPAL